ncbi:hypothetical protein [Nocardia sp. IFM 10818]
MRNLFGIDVREGGDAVLHGQRHQRDLFRGCGQGDVRRGGDLLDDRGEPVGEARS